MLQICGGDWAKHNTETGGYFRCNINPSPPDATSAGDDSSSSQPVDALSTQAGSSSSQPGAGAGLLGALFGKVTSAGAKWKLDYFMRRFLAHECSHRQLEVHSELQFDKQYGSFSADYQPCLIHVCCMQLKSPVMSKQRRVCGMWTMV